MSVGSSVADGTVVSEACAAVGLDSSGLDLLHHHATGVYLHRAAHVVLRVNRGKDRERARTAVAVARWLVELGFPATAPLDVPQPVEIDDCSITFWHYYPQADRSAPEPAALGKLLRQLHELPSPSIALPRYQPLTRLGTVLERSTCLPEDDRTWLVNRRAELLDQYDTITTELGVGFIHGDAYPGNLLWNGDQAILGDWDEVAIGPRELDLTNTHQGVRFGRTPTQLRAFNSAYGWDVSQWTGFPILREMRDLHTLAVYIERATAGDDAAATELGHRLGTVRAADAGAAWHSA